MNTPTTETAEAKRQRLKQRRDDLRETIRVWDASLAAFLAGAPLRDEVTTEDFDRRFDLLRSELQTRDALARQQEREATARGDGAAGSPA